MANQAKSVKNSKKHLTKAEIEAREQAEAKVVTNETKPDYLKFITRAAEKKLFEMFAGMNDNYTESDSISLSLLAKSLHRYTLINQALDKFDILDEAVPKLEQRALAYGKSIDQHMKDLCIPLSQRLKLANEMAKVMIEEKKLEQMEKDAEPKEINPALQILARINEMNKNGGR